MLIEGSTVPLRFLQLWALGCKMCEVWCSFKEQV